jgi:hypothetical protein
MNGGLCFQKKYLEAYALKKYVDLCIQNKCMASYVFRIKYGGLYIQKNIYGGLRLKKSM